MSKAPEKFDGVSVVTKANVYFDGKVVSHSVLFADGSKKTVGLIYPGKFHFGTDKAERMEIVAGACSVKLDGQSAMALETAEILLAVPGWEVMLPGGGHPRASALMVLAATEVDDAIARVTELLAAAPVDGAANAACRAFLAKRLDVAKSRLTILRGETARAKLIRIRDANTTDVVARLRAAE